VLPPLYGYYDEFKCVYWFINVIVEWEIFGKCFETTVSMAVSFGTPQ